MASGRKTASASSRRRTGLGFAAKTPSKPRGSSLRSADGGRVGGGARASK